jgi:plastocyanin
MSSKVLPMLVAGVVLGLAVVAARPRAAEGGESRTVEVVIKKDMTFNPEKLTIKAGDNVVWVNEDAVAHTATATDGSWDTGLIPAGGRSKAITFKRAGTVQYVCTPHRRMMKASIVVE